MKKEAIIVLVYGIMVASGGIMGFVKAHSLISLIMGLVFGIILIFASITLFKKSLLGAYIACIVSLILGATFLFRYCSSQVFFPSAFMALVSALVLIKMTLFLNSKGK